MDWTHDGIVLSTRKHGETSAIVTLMTRQKGRHAGLVRGGAGRRQRGVLNTWVPVPANSPMSTPPPSSMTRRAWPP